MNWKDVNRKANAMLSLAVDQQGKPEGINAYNMYLKFCKKHKMTPESLKEKRKTREPKKKVKRKTNKSSEFKSYYNMYKHMFDEFFGHEQEFYKKAKEEQTKKETEHQWGFSGKDINDRAKSNQSYYNTNNRKVHPFKPKVGYLKWNVSKIFYNYDSVKGVYFISAEASSSKTNNRIAIINFCIYEDSCRIKFDKDENYIFHTNTTYFSDHYNVKYLWEKFYLEWRKLK